VNIDKIMLDSRGSFRHQPRKLNMKRVPSHCINENGGMKVQDLIAPTGGATLYAKEIDPYYEQR
jgi:hypothetical protein